MRLPNFSKKKSIVILISFILTFIIARIIVFLIDHQVDPDLLGYNIVNGRHIHHFTYGIVILVVTGFISLFIGNRGTRAWLFALYGIGLGLLIDEFGIWLNLDPNYHQTVSIIAVLIVTTFLMISAFIEDSYRTLI